LLILVDVARARADFRTDQRLAEERAFDQGDAEGFTTSMGRKNDGAGVAVQRDFGGIVDVAGEMDVGQAEADGLLFQLTFHRPAAHDDHGEWSVPGGFEQEMQALVVAKHPNKQEVVAAVAPTHRGQLFAAGNRIALLIEPDWNDVEFGPVQRQHRAADCVLGGSGDNGVGTGQKPVHEGLIEAQQAALANDIGLVADQGWFADASAEMEQVGKGPGKLVVDDIRPIDQLLETNQAAQGTTAGRDFKVAGKAVYLSLRPGQHRRMRVGAEGENAVFNTQGAGGGAELPDGFLEAALAVGKIGAVDVQNFHLFI